MDVKDMAPVRTWTAKRSGDSMTINGIHGGDESTAGKPFVLRGIAEILHHDGRTVAAGKDGQNWPLSSAAREAVTA
jgi:hypothetical protein